ncbi:MAG: class I SAM-dependent methyltransferase [Thermodesulfobacteriota bacterium]
MQEQALDPSHDSEKQRQLWDSLAAGWEKWWPIQERGLQQVSDCLVDLAEIRPGYRVLDIGTGVGEPALTASLRVGPEGQVIATDLSPQMLAIAGKRAAALELQNLEFREMAAEALNFPESCFDAILARFSLMFLSDIDAALARILRMLVSNGKFASAVWDASWKVPIFNLAFDLAKRMFQQSSKTAGTVSVFSLAEGILEKALTQAGFSNIQTKVLEGSMEFASVGALTQFLGEVNAPLAGLLADQPAALQAAYWQALAEAAQKFARTDGSIDIPTKAICVVGQR